MAFTTRDQVLAAIGRGYQGFALKMPTGNLATNRTTTLWNQPGIPAGAGVIPAASAATCSSATRGALPMPSIVTSGNRLYLAGYSLFGYSSNSSVTGAITVYDRAAHMGGIVQNINTAQTVGLSAPARLSSTVGYVPLLETYSASSTSTQNWTMSYTNSSGVAGRTATLTVPMTTAVGQTAPFVLQAGDVGVSSVQTVTLTQSSAAAGTVAIVLAKSLLNGTISNYGMIMRRNFVHMLDIGVDPCLYMAATAASAAQAVYSMTYTVVEG